MIRMTRRTTVFSLALILIAPLFLPVRQADAQGLVQVPFASIAVGVAATTYNGSNGLACTSTTAGYLDFYGDGCPPTQATLTFPYAVAIDKANNVYVAEYGTNQVRVVYQAGTALAAALVAGEPKNGSFTPTPGIIYNLGGGTATLKSVGGFLYCNGVSGTVALDSAANGCPTQYAYIRPRNILVDRDGNIYIASIVPFQGVRIIYVGGTAAANLITAYNPKVLAPQPGYIYSLSVSGDFIAIRDVAIDSTGSLYAIDNGAQSTVTGLQATTSGNQIKKFSGTGWTTYINGTATAGPTLPMGDGGPATAALVSLTPSAAALFFDGSDNLYIEDGNDSRVRVVYKAGTTPPLYIEGANSTVISTPAAGNIYTVAGGGSSTMPGSLASNVSTGIIASIGMDGSGNLLFMDVNHSLWREDPRSGIAVIIGGNGALYSSTVPPTTTAPAAGVPCNGVSGGPVMTDAYSDGCPASEVYAYSPSGRIVFDTAGNLYQVEYRSSQTLAVGIVRRYSYNNQFGSHAVGSSTTIAVAYTPATSATSTPTTSYLLTGNATSEFFDAGNDVCSLTGIFSVQTCVYNVGFKPALAGLRLGALTLTGGGSTLVSTLIGGVGVGSQVALDPATQSIIGSGLSTAGVVVDQGNNIYISDKTTGNVYRSIAGGSPAVFASGFSSPAQMAVNGSGTLYVADTGNNRIASVASGSVSSFLTSFGGIALKSPAGVAADASGNVYVADTGNNRVLVVGPFGNVALAALTGLSSPLGLALDAGGDLFVADSGNARVVELTPAGAQTAVTSLPSFVSPVGVAVDPAGDLYVADSGNQNVTLIPQGSTNGTTLLGNSGGLTGLACDTTGSVYVASATSGGVTKLNRNQLTMKFADTNVAQTFSQVLQVSNVGNSALTLGSSLANGSDTTNFSIGPSTTNGCSNGGVLLGGQNCGLLAVFQPTVRGAFTDTVNFPNNAANLATATLIGTGVQKIGTSATLAYATTTGGLPLGSKAFAITLTVTPVSNIGSVGGSVIFTVDGGPQQMATVLNGTASTSYTLAAGSHTVVATYSGDANYVASAAALSLSVVNPAATTISNLAVTSSGPPLNNLPFTISATVTSTAVQGAISGTIDFTANGITQTVPLVNGSASATFALPTGKYSVTANYSGNSYYFASTGTLAVQALPAGTSSVNLSIASPTGSISFGQSVATKAAITTGNATGAPTGTVTFTVDGGAAQIVPYASSVSTIFAFLNAGVHVLAAAYSGDNSYAPSMGSLNVTVLKAGTVTSIAITPNVSGAGNTYTLKASVSAASGAPSGTVAFAAGATALGSAPIVNGVATLTTASSTFPSYAFTGVFSGDFNFLPSTLGVSPSPDFVVGVADSSISVPQYGTGLTYALLSSFYGYGGTVQLTCTGLPENSLCRTSPLSAVTSPGTNQSIQLQIFVDVNPTTASIERHAKPGAGTIASAIAFCLLLGFPSFKSRKGLQRLAGVCVALLLALHLSGCGSNTAGAPVYVTPTGAYQVTVSATDGQITHTSIVSLTVLPGSPARP